MTKILVVGYPKSGTTWLSRLLGDVLDSPVGAIHPPSTPKAIATEGQGRQGEHYIGQGHPVPVPGGNVLSPKHTELAYEHLTSEKIVLVLRDPRDICVSGAHHWDRPLLEYIHCLGQGKWPMPHGGGLVPWVRAWMSSGLPECVTRYEWLHKDTTLELWRILHTLHLQPVKDVEAVVARQSFHNRREWTKTNGHSLNYGRDFQLRFLRKGIVGDWRNEFGPEEKALAEQYFGELLDELDYR